MVLISCSNVSNEGFFLNIITEVGFYVTESGNMMPEQELLLNLCQMDTKFTFFDMIFDLLRACFYLQLQTPVLYNWVQRNDSH